MDLHLDRVSNIPVTGWALVVAGAAFGGAVLHVNRLVGAAIVGGLALAYELSQAPCCAGCAQGAGCGGELTTPVTATPAVGLPEQTASGVPAQQQATSVTPLANDYPGSRPSSPFDPGTIFAPPAVAGPSSSSGTAVSPCMGCS